MEIISEQLVEEIIEPAKSGMTQPYLCRLSDDQTYYVKGRGATTKGLIAEVVCAELGRAFGLPIPDYSVAYLESDLINDDPDLRLYLGSGWAFASKSQGAMIVLTQRTLRSKDTAMLRKLFVFDNWIMNEDRTGTGFAGNSNLFLRTAEDKLCVLDHNLAFDSAFKIATNMSHHIARGFWNCDLFGPLAGHEFREDMEEALESVVGFSDVLPEQWIVDEPEFCGAIEQYLLRFRSVDFWSEMA